MLNKILSIFQKDKHKPRFGALDLLKYIGPGLLVTVGFIDPGNWASNLAAGSAFGYTLLWMVSLSTIMLIILQHNVAHLGIATGLCLAEAATIYLKPKASRFILFSAMGASVSTSLAEIIGAAIALKMLWGIPIRIGAVLVLVFVVIMLLSNSYRMIEKWIIGFVSVIGLSFIYELTLVDINWSEALQCWVTPAIPENSMIVIMSVLGAVVMPHNLFLHSEVIQSRQWNLEEEKIIRKQLKYEFFDTFFSMIIGWAINSAMILLAASTFFTTNTPVSEIEQAKQILEPLLGKSAGIVFAIALLFAGVASTITSGMAAGTIYAGINSEPFDIKDNHTRLGVVGSLIIATIIIFFVGNPFWALVISQLLLSIQLPITVFLQVYLTSSNKVMGKYANVTSTKIILYIIAAIIAILNIMLFVSFFI